MSQEQGPTSALLLRMTMVQPDRRNGLEHQPLAVEVVLTLDTSVLRSPEEVTAIIAIRLRRLLESVESRISTDAEKYNAEHPVEEQPAEQEEEDAPDLQA